MQSPRSREGPPIMSLPHCSTGPPAHAVRQQRRPCPHVLAVAPRFVGVGGHHSTLAAVALACRAIAAFPAAASTRCAVASRRCAADAG